MAPSRTKRLVVECYGVEVAEITAKRPWEIRCRYTDEAVARWPGNAPVLSCSLLLGRRSQVASPFFSGLLPEGQHLAALAARAGIAANDVFGLLAHYGRDVAGALVISGGQIAARIPGVVPYDDDQLAEEVAGLHEHPLAVYDDSELSIPGLQDKMLLVELREGRWGRPIHGEPSTHILKIDDRIRPGLVTAEAACLRLASDVGLRVADARLVQIANVDCLVVRRFDRSVGVDGRVHRVHQEDACQALGRDLRAGGKYERSGGPSLREVATLLNRYAENPEEQLDRLSRSLAFTIVIGNADAHGKNIALLHDTPSTISLAPLYDTVPTVMWPALRRDAAMSVNGRFSLDGITLEDIAAEARSWSFSTVAARGAASTTAERLRDEARARIDEHELMPLVVERAERFLG